MRPIIPSATLTLISAASTTRAAVGTDKNHSALTLPDHADPSSVTLPGYVNQSSVSTSPASTKSDVSLRKKESPDLGVLARSSCHEGRCHDKPDISSWATQTSRRLAFYCPIATCPEEFCTCQQSSTFRGCATEINSICISGDIPNCLDAYYTVFYETIYCNLASCYLDDVRKTEDCICDYHQDYCNLYSDEETGGEHCAIATCCDHAGMTNKKGRCFGEMPQPSKNTVEAGDSNAKPTSRPSKSPSSKPTTTPTYAPITSSPRKSPSRKPTVSPTNAPNTSIPSNLPSPTKKPLILSPVQLRSANPTLFPTKGPASAPKLGPTHSLSKEPPLSSPTGSPLYSRCGDFTCNAEENPATCESDCIVTSFKATASSNANSRGLMFTVNAITDLTIFSFDVFGSKHGNGRCVVYTRAGGYQGYENSDEGWELILNKDVATTQGGRTNLGTLRHEIRTLAGSTQAFYIWCEKGILYTETTSEGNPIISDFLLILNEGIATDKLFERGADTAEFNGWIRYYSSSSTEDGPI